MDRTENEQIVHEMLEHAKATPAHPGPCGKLPWRIVDGYIVDADGKDVPWHEDNLARIVEAVNERTAIRDMPKHLGDLHKKHADLQADLAACVEALKSVTEELARSFLYAEDDDYARDANAALQTARALLARLK